MTNKPIDELSNEELNAAIAREVMGWVAGDAGHDDAEPVEVGYWRPATSIEQAWRVVGRICVDPLPDCWTGPIFTVDKESGESEWHAAFDYLEDYGYPCTGADANAATAPLAICHAALKAVEG